MPIELVMPSNHLILCSPLLLLPSIFPSISIFSSESALHIRWPKYCSFSFSISASNEYSGLISFRIDWFDLLAVQRTLKSFLQHHSSKASVLQCSVQFSSVPSLSHVWLFATPWLQHVGAPGSSPTPGVYLNSCPLSWWCRPTISSSVIRFCFCPQSFPALGSFQMSQLSTSGAKVLAFQLQHQSFRWTLRADLL